VSCAVIRPVLAFKDIINNRLIRVADKVRLPLFVIPGSTRYP